MDIVVKNPLGVSHFGHFSAPEGRGGVFCPVSRSADGVKNPRGVFAPSGGAGIPKMLTVEVQKHQYSTGFIRVFDVSGSCC